MIFERFFKKETKKEKVIRLVKELDDNWPSDFVLFSRELPISNELYLLDNRRYHMVNINIQGGDANPLIGDDGIYLKVNELVLKSRKYEQ